MSNKKVGIFSGTFDPIHVGHIEFALETIKSIDLAQVVFLPEQNPRQKSPASYLHRSAMIKLATAKYPRLLLEQLEEPQFSVAKTLPKLQELYKQTGLVLLIGSDAIKTFSYRWPGLDQLLGSVQLAVGIRAGDDAQQTDQQLMQSYKEYDLQPNYTLLRSPHEHLASTNIRTNQHTINDISPEVAAYIKQHQLY